MNTLPIKTRVPPNSRGTLRLDGASFCDSWGIIANDINQPALGYFIAAAKRTPGWIEVCMAARNRVGKMVGIKDLGPLSGLPDDKQACEYKSGERVGIFTVFENTFDEAVIGDQDKHLNVMLSIYREKHPDGTQVTITVTTIVHVNNMLGRIYMLPVIPMHRIIAPTVLSAIGKAGNAA